MARTRIALFISHKVGLHGPAARRIKDIVESRTERLDVFVCEDVEAGERWRDVIAKTISRTKILLVLWPGPNADARWIQAEIEYFMTKCRNGRLVVLKSPGDPLPAFLREVQVIDTSKEKLRDRFLAPLYQDPGFTKSKSPLNDRVLQDDIERDAEEIAAALRGIVRPRAEFYRESLVVDTSQCDVIRDGFDLVQISAPDGCRKILNWNQSSFSWQAFREHAAEDKGKGTFWVSEMERVILDVARDDYPRVMTSTFRGRGSVAGLIFRPNLDHVEFVEKRPVKYHFVFYEVLVPELVRGPGQIGDVFSILYIATRVRWEVLNPFLVNRFLARGASRFEMSEDEREQLMGQICNSIRIIDQEAARHGVVQAAVDAFDGADRDEVERMLAERELLRQAILDAATRKDFAVLMTKLARALDLNTRVLDLLASRFQNLVRKDRGAVLKLLAEAAATPAPPAGFRTSAVVAVAPTAAGTVLRAGDAGTVPEH